MAPGGGLHVGAHWRFQRMWVLWPSGGPAPVPELAAVGGTRGAQLPAAGAPEHHSRAGLPGTGLACRRGGRGGLFVPKHPCPDGVWGRQARAVQALEPISPSNTRTTRPKPRPCLIDDLRRPCPSPASARARQTARQTPSRTMRRHLMDLSTPYRERRPPLPPATVQINRSGRWRHQRRIASMASVPIQTRELITNYLADTKHIHTSKVPRTYSLQYT